MSADHPTTHFQARLGRDWVTTDTLAAAEAALRQLRRDAFDAHPDSRWSAIEPIIVGPLAGSAA